MNVTTLLLLARLIVLWLFRFLRWTVRRLIAKPA
jgi:hypothetical protein